MKLTIHLNEKKQVVQYEANSDLKDLMARVSIAFGIMPSNENVLATIPNGTIIDKTNQTLLTDGGELTLKIGGKPIPTISSNSFIRGDRNRLNTMVQNSFLNNAHGGGGGSPSSHSPAAASSPHSPSLGTNMTSNNNTAINSTNTPASPRGGPVDNLGNISNQLHQVNHNTSAASSPSTSNILIPTITTSTASSPSSSSIVTSAAPTTTATQPIQPTIESILQSLNDLSLKKKALFDLKDVLKEESNVRKFVEKEGLGIIEQQLKEYSGNTLSYALVALQSAMHFDIGANAIPSSLITSILNMLDSSSPMIPKSVLSILTLYCSNNRNGYEDLTTNLFPQISKSILLNNSNDSIDLKSSTSSTTTTTTSTSNNSSTPRTIYTILVNLLSSPTVDIQLNSLTLINELIVKSIQKSPQSTTTNTINILNELDQLDINSKLKKIYDNLVSNELKKQLYFYQKHKLNLLKNRKNIMYNMENQEHEALLMKLWTTIFPDVKLESRVSEQWKVLGFQGTNPSTDFRGMGLLGLENLLYFAINHLDQFKKIVNSNIERKERDYPMAVAGITLTQMFLELFKMAEDSNPDYPIFPILFSHKFAFEEVYSLTFNLLDSTWDTMNASYMEFPKVLATVKQSIITALDTKPTTLEAFNWAAGSSKKTNNFHQHGVEDDVLQSEDIKKLKQNINRDIMDLIKYQKVNILSEGILYKLQRPIKGKVLQTHFFIKLSPDQSELLYVYLAEPIEGKITNFTGNVKLPEITFIADSKQKPTNSSGKTGNTSEQKSIALNYFSISIAKETIELIANTREDIANLVDGTKCLLGKQIECVETIEEYKTLMDLSLKLKLLDLEGIELPKSPPKLPDVPRDFIFSDTIKQK